jgi:arylsulfatase A-like enzyme
LYSKNSSYKKRAGISRLFIRRLTAITLLALTCLLPISSCSKPKPPHIFIIIIDAARYDLLKEYTKDNHPLMNAFHQFSTTATSYSSCFANAPYTGPSVASMLTGLYPETHSVRKPGSQASENTPFLQKKLASAGYHTTIITGNAVLLRHHLVQSFAQTAFIRPLSNNNTFRQSSYQDIQQAQSVIQNLDFNRPQFVYIHLLPPHEPYNPPQPWNQHPVKGPNQRYNNYLRNAAYADHLTGQLLNQLKILQQFDDALVILGSDHGEAFGEHGHQGHITNVYNETIHVPLLLKLPRQTIPQTIATPCSLMDISPTILNHLNLPPNPTIQARPLPFSQSRKIVKSRPIYSRAVGDTLHAALIDFPLKYIHTNGTHQLYNLQTDPQETTNIADSQLNATNRLKKALLHQHKQNLQLRTRLRITPTEKRIELPQMMKELKTLGYL